MTGGNVSVSGPEGADSKAEVSRAIAPIEPLHPVPVSELPTWRNAIEHGSVLIAKEVRDQLWKFEQITQDAEPSLALAVPVGDDECLTYVAPNVDPLVLGPHDLGPQYGYPVLVRLLDGTIQERAIETRMITKWVQTLLHRQGIDRRDASRIYALSQWRGMAA